MVTPFSACLAAYVKRGWLSSTVLVLLCNFFLISPAVAVVYKYQDSAGNFHFTDRPMKGRGYQLIWQSGAYGSTGSRARVDTAAMERNRARYTPLINTTANRININPELLHAVVMVESSYDPKARSRVGAVGLMQLMPATAERYGVMDRYNPKANLDGGARYLKDLLAMFQNDLKLALAGYNAGENAVIKYGNRIPPYSETQRYVQKVLTLYRKSGGTAATLTSR